MNEHLLVIHQQEGGMPSSDFAALHSLALAEVRKKIHVFVLTICEPPGCSRKPADRSVSSKNVSGGRGFRAGANNRIRVRTMRRNENLNTRFQTDAKKLILRKRFGHDAAWCIAEFVIFYLLGGFLVWLVVGRYLRDKWQAELGEQNRRMS